MMDLLDWQGSSADAEKLLGLLHKQGLEAALYRRGEQRAPASLTVLADTKGAYFLQEPYPLMGIFEGGDLAARKAVAKTGIPVITVGLSERDTVTYSSLAQDHCAVTVGRPFLTLRGTSIQEQEVILPCPCGDIQLLLFFTAALVLGVPPDQLPALFTRHPA